MMLCERLQPVQMGACHHMTPLSVMLVPSIGPGHNVSPLWSGTLSLPATNLKKASRCL